MRKNSLKNYLAIQTRKNGAMILMKVVSVGKNVNVSDIRRIVQDIPGVSTLSEIKIFNKVGGQYSSSETSQNYIDEETKQIRLIDDTIYVCRHC